MALAFDEFGRLFIILKEHEQKTRLRSLEAQKSNISATKTVARILRNSLGPKGMDKMLHSLKADITITNDGATILEQMEVDNCSGYRDLGRCSLVSKKETCWRLTGEATRRSRTLRHVCRINTKHSWYKCLSKDETCMV